LDFWHVWSCWWKDMVIFNQWLLKLLKLCRFGLISQTISNLLQG
jgi:hypothetical protein